MHSKVFKIKQSIDIYEIPLDNSEEVNIQFYKINTREKISIQSSKKVSEFLAKIDGKTILSEICINAGLDINDCDNISFINFLIEKGILIESSHYENSDFYEMYNRQINYFDDLLVDKTGYEAQKLLEEQEVVIFGIGSVGASIAIHLVRSGVKRLTLIDYKKISISSIERHPYADKTTIGQYKTTALSNYLKRVNPNCSIICFNEKILPQSNIWNFISASASVVVNTADEPYIGHINVKLGRELWGKIPLYAAGGFDAHSMSTGEFIINGLTPCIDCYSNTFKKALKNWKPTYQSSDSLKRDNESNSLQPLIGGAAGIIPQSLFSASYATMSIINYLVGNIASKNKFSQRGEYILNKGIITWVQLEIQKGCAICGF